MQHIESDPCFNIHTADGKYWIDPFTGKRASAAKNNRVTAFHHYFQTYPHWQKYPIKSVQEAWSFGAGCTSSPTISVKSSACVFSKTGHWLNPFTGTWHNEVRRVEGRITSMTLHEMAKILAVTVEQQKPRCCHLKPCEALFEAPTTRKTSRRSPIRCPAAQIIPPRETPRCIEEGAK